MTRSSFAIAVFNEPKRTDRPGQRRPWRSRVLAVLASASVVSNVAAAATLDQATSIFAFQNPTIVVSTAQALKKIAPAADTASSAAPVAQRAEAAPPPAKAPRVAAAPPAAPVTGVSASPSSADDPVAGTQAPLSITPAASAASLPAETPAAPPPAPPPAPVIALLIPPAAPAVQSPARGPEVEAVPPAAAGFDTSAVGWRGLTLLGFAGAAFVVRVRRRAARTVRAISTSRSASLQTTAGDAPETILREIGTSRALAHAGDLSHQAFRHQIGMTVATAAALIAR